jgi:hypothetical protein
MADAVDPRRRADLAQCGPDRRALEHVGTGVMLAIWQDPATLDEWRNSGGLDEAFIDVPLKVVAIGWNGRHRSLLIASSPTSCP